MENIYNKINNLFYSKTNIDIQKGTVIDSFLLAISDMIENAYTEIENNKTPYLYSKLSGSNLDDMAMLCGLTRQADESDKNFLYRLVKWNTSNKASNLDAIETKLINMDYCSHVTYIPFAYGCGTAAAYIIPKEMTDECKKLAINETKNKLSLVTSPSTYIEYIIPEILPVKLTIAYKINGNDNSSIKDDISTKIIEYINQIPVGSYLEIGEINKIGISNIYMNYFNIIGININGEEKGDLSILQKVESKFLIEYGNIYWIEVE